MLRAAGTAEKVAGRARGLDVSTPKQSRAGERDESLNMTRNVKPTRVAVWGKAPVNLPAERWVPSEVL